MDGTMTTPIREHWPLLPASTSDLGGQESLWIATRALKHSDVDVAARGFNQWSRTETEYILADEDMRCQRAIHWDERWPSGSWRDRASGLVQGLSTAPMYWDERWPSGSWRDCASGLVHEFSIAPMSGFGTVFYRFPEWRLEDANLVYLASSGEYVMMETKAFHSQVVGERAQRINEMEAMLHRFMALPDNWDSYGATAPHDDAVKEARRILRTVISLDLPEPWTAPGGDAGIGLQWETDGADLYIDIVPGEDTTYALTPKTGASEEDGVLTKQNLTEVLRRFAALAT